MQSLLNFFAFIWKWILRHKVWSVGTIIIVGVLVYFLRPKQQQAIPTVTVQRSQFEQSVSVSGTVQAKNTADLTFLEAGKLVYLGAKKGDFVNQYQKIAVLDQRTVQTNLQNALIDYSKQRLTFDQTQQNGQNGALQAQQKTSLEQTGAQAKLGQGTDEANAVNNMVKDVLANNQYDLDKAVNSVQLQELAQENSVLTTPISGILTRTDADSIGINVAPTTTFTVVDPTSMVFDMGVDEADIGSVADGQNVDITLDAFPDTTLHLPVSSIDFVSHTTSTGGTAYTVEVKLPQNNEYTYKVGMSGNADIVTNQKNNVISIPVNAVVNNQYIYIQQTNGFVKRNVKVGLQNDTDVEIISGLQLGEKVAVDPTQASKEAVK